MFHAGIVFGKGESWKVMRRFTLSTLRDFGMGKKTIEDRIIEESQRLVEVFQSHKGKPFDPQIIINSAVSNIICSIVFGDRFDYDDAQFLNLQRIVNESVKLAASPKTQGESWKVMRRFTLSTLRDFGMGKKTIEDRIIEESQRLVEVFQSHKGKPFDPQIIINSAVSNIICSIVFGDRFDYDDAQFLNLQRIVNESVKLAASPKTQLYNMFPFLGFFLSDHKKVQTNRIMMQEYFRNAYKDCKDSVDSNDLRSFIDTFISRQREEEARNPIKYFHEDNMAVTAVDLFAAGTETTSTTLRWGLLLMMKYPHIQGERGTPVILLLSSVLSDKTQWETPHQFNPNHFLDAQGKFVKRDAFMPFSAGQCVREEQGPGRRVCLGETLAKMELFLFFTMLLQKFQFRPPQEVSPEQLDLTPTPGIASSLQPFQLCALSH
ncbi:UNVERIFIED_CONTAM: hypothetical protein FKN15_066969 [Acipenser sinensis]